MVAFALRCRERSKARRIVVKLNEGFSGEGNALMKIDGAAMTKVSEKQPSFVLPRFMPR